jgi:hypothetical protein
MGILDTPAYSRAQSDAKRSGRTLFGQYPAPICAGRVFRASSASSITAETFQRVYRLLNDASQVRLVFVNMLPQGSPQENSYGSYTLKASVIWDYVPGSSGGILVPVTFNGASTVTVGTYQVMVSDPIDVSYATVSGSYFVVRSYVTSAGAFLPVAANDPSTVNSWNEGHKAGDFTAAIDSFSSANADLGFGPTAIVGWPTSGRNNGTFLTGDSIMAGTGWLFGQTLGQGFGPYALLQGAVPGINYSRSSEKVQDIVNYGLSKYRMNIAQGCKYAVSNYGTNDIGAARTFAQVSADLVNYWKYMARRGLSVYQTTILPRNTTTNGWQTVAAQAFYGGGTQEGYRQQLNTWLRAPASAGAGNSALVDAAGALTGIFDVTLGFEANADGSAITINAATGAISNGAGGYHLTDTTSYSSGTVTSIPAASKLDDSTKAWTSAQWRGYSVVIVTDTTTPAAVGQCIQIATNSAAELNLNANWTTTPSTAATYRIMKILTTDGIHPTLPGHQQMAANVDTTKLVPA